MIWGLRETHTFSKWKTGLSSNEYWIRRMWGSGEHGLAPSVLCHSGEKKPH